MSSAGLHNQPTVVTNVEQSQDAQQKEKLVLRLKPPVDNGPRVTFAPGVLENYRPGRMKSNCCCMYFKPRKWDDPTTWEQDEHETEHCRGHTLPSPRKKSDDTDEEQNNKQAPEWTPPGCSDGCC